MSDPDAPLLYVLTGLYYVSGTLGLMVCVPLAITTYSFQGACLLGGISIWAPSPAVGGGLVVAVASGPDSRCNFTIYLTAISAVIYALIMALVHSCDIRKGNMDFYSPHDMAGCMNIILLAVYACVNAMVALLLLISACLFTVGVHEWCDSLTRGTPLQRCSEAQSFKNSDIKWSDDRISSSSFYACLLMVLVSSWLLFAVWLCQTAFICFFWMQQAFGRQFYRQAVNPTTSAALNSTGF